MRIFFYIIAMLVTISNTANASLHAGDNNRCYVEDNGWNKTWWCGQSTDKCSGKTAKGGQRQNYFFFHGEKATIDGTTYYCCNGTEYQSGRFKQATSFTETEEITVTLPAGKCMYKKITDICGNVISDEPCTTATFDCEDGFALAGTTSPKCIECPETNTQGIQETDNGKTCIKCASNKFFDKDSQTCKDKEWLQQNKIAITKDTMAKCFQCPGTDIYKKCVLMFDAPDHLSTGVDKDRIKTQCKL